MGSKNRIFLGIITPLIVHNIRNIFKSKKLFISNKKAKKISIDHPKQAVYIEKHSFQVLLDNCIASCEYKEDGIINFITYTNNEYLIFGISNNNFYNELSTIFKPSIRQLIKCKDTIVFFKNEYKIEFEKYIN